MIFRTLVLVLAMWPCAAAGQYNVNYEASMTAGGGNGDFAPYYISSLRHGKITQRSNIQTEAKLWRDMDSSSRFSYGFGADIVAGYASAVNYERYDVGTGSWYTHSERPSSIWLQQLYGELKWRGVFVLAGMKEHTSALLNQSLTSGDLIESGNSRPIPEIRAGFIDFQNIPFTKGWVQIQGEIGYGKMIDDGWWRDHYNYYNYHIARDCIYSYKRCYFRTRPSEPFSATFGMQAAVLFGGSYDAYTDGKIVRSEKFKASIKEFITMVAPPFDTGEGFVTGSHVGSWDIRARYRLKDGTELAAYCSWPWEDGSGIAKLNGWDGLWGIEYRSPQSGIINAALVEYLDFTNQSGPLHFYNGDQPGTTLEGHADGRDDYYNNHVRNSYAYFGMSIGSPALMAPIYNKDGYPAFMANVMRGVHAGIEGDITPKISYRIKGGYRKSWGNAVTLLPAPIHLSSFMVEANWHPGQIKGLTVNACIEMDRGSMPGNATAALVTLKYNGLINF